MARISVEIIITIDERQIKKTTKGKQRKTERGKGNKSYSEKAKAK